MPDGIPNAIHGDPSAWRDAIDPEKLAAGREALARGDSPEDMVSALEERRSLADGVSGGSRFERQGGPGGSADRHLSAAGAETRRGRPPLPKAAPPVDDGLDPATEVALEKVHSMGREVNALLAQDITRQQLELSELLGRIQAFNFVNQFTGMAHLKWLKEIKESKAYKGCKALDAQGQVVEIGTFEKLCELVGVSRSKVAEDLQNLQTFGEEFMESSQRMGLGYRQLRQLRALPEEDRALVIEGEKVGNDPEALKDLLEELVAKQAKDKEDLKKEIKETRADLEASREVAAENAKKLSLVREELARLKNIAPDETELLQAEKEREALKKLSEERLLLRGAFVAYLARARAVLELDDLNQTTAREVMEMTSALCSGMADDIFAAGIDIDFRIIAYPMPCPERGDETAGEQG